MAGGMNMPIILAEALLHYWHRANAFARGREHRIRNRRQNRRQRRFAKSWRRIIGGLLDFRKLLRSHDQTWPGVRRIRALRQSHQVEMLRQSPAPATLPQAPD